MIRNGPETPDRINQIYNLMTNTELKRRAELIYKRQSEQNVLSQLRLFANEEGFNWTNVDKVWWETPTEMEEADEWGEERYTLPTIETMVINIATKY